MDEELDVSKLERYEPSDSVWLDPEEEEYGDSQGPGLQNPA
jgi:hypothetical protein